MQIAVNRKEILRPNVTRVVARFLYMDDERAIYVIAGLLIIVV
jgi:hypothetical protein